MRRFLEHLFSGPDRTGASIQTINRRRAELAKCTDDELKTAGREATELLEVFAVTAVVAARVLGLEMFDVQLQGALALANGKIAEMQTGEGKTLAAVPAVAWYAKAGGGVHVMTVNDYLARRDAQWMGGIYEFLGLSVGYIQQGMTVEERRRAYACDITYSTANEIGFDHLRDGLALYPHQQVYRPFAAAVIDEADSILIDEARIPLVIAGGQFSEEPLAYRVDRVTRLFRRYRHFTLDEYGRNIALTDTGIRAVETSFGCENLFAEENLPLLTAVQDSLHAHALLRRDVDYLVKDGVIESVDEFKGRIAQNRRWPAGLHTAIEAKEGVALKTQGRVLGSITLQNLVAMYPKVCGMTGTAATQADEFRIVYGLDVEVIPTNRPVIRVDSTDQLFDTKREKEAAVIEEIRTVHQTGQPVLVGTRSVEESERLSARLQDIAHQVLNARHEEQEAHMIALAGELAAVTISTNMAGRGTDIKLGAGVAELGGLHVIGTNRHESRRIDHQLRGRAGRQGDPGSSRFFISIEDDLFVKYGSDMERLEQDVEEVQRLVEGQNLDIRQFLHKYESVIEGQRQEIQRRRQQILTGAAPCASELERLISLATIDDLWSEFLATITDLREGVQWLSWGGRQPLYEYLNTVHSLYQQLEARIGEEIPRRLAEAQERGIDPTERGATWTYLTTDQPFGSWSERVMRGLATRYGGRS
ncbi:MAG: accessory Sec system translocase SecA2 [Acidobacteriia bacterium]|nr:accessory Sec system translocase SecA2 [Terriglobia bacterium]